MFHEDDHLLILGATGLFGIHLFKKLDIFHQQYGFLPQITLVTRNKKNITSLPHSFFPVAPLFSMTFLILFLYLFHRNLLTLFIWQQHLQPIRSMGPQFSKLFTSSEFFTLPS